MPSGAFSTSAGFSPSWTFSPSETWSSLQLSSPAAPTVSRSTTGPIPRCRRSCRVRYPEIHSDQIHFLLLMLDFNPILNDFVSPGAIYIIQLPWLKKNKLINYFIEFLINHLVTTIYSKFKHLPKVLPSGGCIKFKNETFVGSLNCCCSFIHLLTPLIQKQTLLLHPKKLKSLNSKQKLKLILIYLNFL